MFCTYCAVQNAPGCTRCLKCGAPIGTTFPARAAGTRHAAPRPHGVLAVSRTGMMMLPFVVALAVGGWFAFQVYDESRRESAAYARAEQALVTGDYVAAIRAFGEAGAYRDAPERRLTAQNTLAPVRTAYLDAIAAMDAGEYEQALALLKPIHETLPEFEDVDTRMLEAQTGLLRALERDVEVAVTRRNWIEADHVLQRLISLDPENANYARRLSDLRLAHAPILFVKSGSLYQVGPDLGDERLLFDDFPIASPLWSPDRRFVSFFSADATRLAAVSLFVYDYETGKVTLISENAAPDPYLAWSHDGKRVAFVTNDTSDRSSARNRTHLTIYDVTTGEIDAIYAPREERLPSDAEYLTDVASPSWSPEDGRIAYVAIRRPISSASGFTMRFADIYTLDVVSGQSANVTKSALPAVAAVTWSPVDDRLLAWESEGGTAWFESSETAIHLIDLASGTIERLTSRTEVNGRPFWSPDGAKYAVVLGDAVVRIRWLPGKREWTVGVDQPISGHLTWSPSGDALVAASRDTSKPSVMLLIGDAVSDQRPLPVAFDGNWPNVGLQWGPLTAPVLLSPATPPPEN